MSDSSDMSELAGMVMSVRQSSGDALKRPVQVLRACELLLKRDEAAQRTVLQFLENFLPKASSLSQSAPCLQLEANRLVWLQFRTVLNSLPQVQASIAEFIHSIRSGQCVLFHRNDDEDVIVESLFPDYRYLLQCRGAEETAAALPELCDLRLQHSRRIDEFHRTAASDDCRIVDVSNEPRVKVRKELTDLEARKLHIVTPQLMDELYEFYKQEALAGIRATTGNANVRSYC